MRGRCAVLDCKTGSDYDDEQVTLFSIPKNKLEIWQKALPYKDKQLTHRDVICEKHFRKSDIIKDMKTRDSGVKKPKLAAGAVPSVFRGSKNKPVTPRNKKLEEKVIQQVSKKTRVSETHLKAVEGETLLDPALRKKFNKRIQELRLVRKSGKTFSKKEYDELVSKAKKARKNCQYDVVSVQGESKLVDFPEKAKSKFYAHDGELFDLFHRVHVDLKHADAPNMQKELNKKYKNIAYGDICAFVNMCPTCLENEAETSIEADKQTQNGSNSVGTPLQVKKRKSKGDKNKSGLCKNCKKQAYPQIELCPGCKLKADVAPSLHQLSLQMTNDRLSRAVGTKQAFQTLLQRERRIFKMIPFLSKEKYDELLAQVKAATDKKQSQQFLKNHDTVELEGVTRLIRPNLRGHVFKYYVHFDELYDILQYTHLQLEHGSWQKMFTEFKKVFVNITFRDIVTYLSLCETCQKNGGPIQSSATK